MIKEVQLINSVIKLTDDTINQLKGGIGEVAVKDGKPSFTPNMSLGEGTPTKEELQYRTELLAVLGVLYPSLVKIVKDAKLSTDNKITKVNKLIDNYLSDSQGIMSTNTKLIFDNAVLTGNVNLQSLKSNIKNFTPKKGVINPLLNQQNSNLVDIATSLNAKITMGLQMDEISSTLNDNYEASYDYIDTSFYNIQTRLEGMGWYGYKKATDMGYYFTYSFGVSILGDLVADWITCEDDGSCSTDGPVCEDCLAMKDGGPYHVLLWPDEVHFFDRCKMGVPYLLSSMDTSMAQEVAVPA